MSARPTETTDVELVGRRFRLSLASPGPGAQPRLRVHPLLAAAQRGQEDEGLLLALGVPIFLGEPEEEAPDKSASAVATAAAPQLTGLLLSCAFAVVAIVAAKKLMK